MANKTTWSGLGIEVNLDGLSLDLSLFNSIQSYIRILNPFNKKLRFLGGYTKVLFNYVNNTEYNIVFVDDLSTSLQFGTLSRDNKAVALIVNVHILGLRFTLSKAIACKNNSYKKTHGKKRRK